MKYMRCTCDKIRGQRLFMISRIPKDSGPDAAAAHARHVKHSRMQEEHARRRYLVIP